MTKKEHILFWTVQVDEDFDCANVLFRQIILLNLCFGHIWHWKNFQKHFG